MPPAGSGADCGLAPILLETLRRVSDGGLLGAVGLPTAAAKALAVAGSGAPEVRGASAAASAPPAVGASDGDWRISSPPRDLASSGSPPSSRLASVATVAPELWVVSPGRSLGRSGDPSTAVWGAPPLRIAGSEATGGMDWGALGILRGPATATIPLPQPLCRLDPVSGMAEALASLPFLLERVVLRESPPDPCDFACASIERQVLEATSRKTHAQQIPEVSHTFGQPPNATPQPYVRR